MGKADLTADAPLPYAALTGPFGDDFDRIGEKPFLLQANLPADVLAACVDKIAPLAHISEAAADMGCGRILVGYDKLTADGWSEIAATVATMGGHAMLEAAPAEFKADHDVYGPEQSAWQLMHRVKRALDPDGVFAPGRLPGRV